MPQYSGDDVAAMLSSRGIDLNKAASPDSSGGASAIGEWGKTIARGALSSGEGVLNAAKGVSDIAGRAIGVKAKDNVVSNALNTPIEALQISRTGMPMGSEDSFAKSGVAPAETPFTENREYMAHHGVQKFASDIVEGTIPWLLPGSVLKSGKALGAFAGISSFGAGVQRLSDKGMDSDEAMARQAFPSAVEGGMFGMMHGAQKAIMGTSVYKDLAGNIIKNAKDMIPGKFTAEWVPGAIEKGIKGAEDTPLNPVMKAAAVAVGEPGGIGQRVGKEAVFMGGYLHAQGEATQAASLISGAETTDEYAQQHGIDGNKPLGENIKGFLGQQAKSIATGALTGAAFSIVGKNERDQNDLINKAALMESIKQAKARSTVDGSIDTAQQEIQAQQQAQAQADASKNASSLIVQSVNEHAQKAYDPQTLQSLIDTSQNLAHDPKQQTAVYKAATRYKEGMDRQAGKDIDEDVKQAAAAKDKETLKQYSYSEDKIIKAKAEEALSKISEDEQAERQKIEDARAKAAADIPKTENTAIKASHDVDAEIAGMDALRAIKAKQEAEKAAIDGRAEPEKKASAEQKIAQTDIKIAKADADVKLAEANRESAQGDVADTYEEHDFHEQRGQEYDAQHAPKVEDEHTPEFGGTPEGVSPDSPYAKEDIPSFMQLTSGENKANDPALDTHLSALMEAHGVEVRVVNDMKKRFGINSLGVTDILNKIITVAGNRKIDTLPEEAVHMSLGMIGKSSADNPLAKQANELYSNIHKWSGYERVRRQYQEQYKGNERLIRQEAAAKFIAEALVGQHKASGSLYFKAINFIKKAVAWVKEQFGGDTNYRNAQDLASRIMSGDIGKETSARSKDVFHQLDNDSRAEDGYEERGNPYDRDGKEGIYEMPGKGHGEHQGEEHSFDEGQQMSKYDHLVKDGRASKEGNVYYLDHADDLDSIATVHMLSKSIVINMERAKKSWDEKAVNGVASESKKIMFQKMGTTPENFYNSFKNFDEYIEFLKNHEQYHLNGNGGEKYPRKEDGHIDINNPKAINNELKATLNAMTDEQIARMHELNGNTLTDVLPGGKDGYTAPKSADAIQEDKRVMANHPSEENEQTFRDMNDADTQALKFHPDRKPTEFQNDGVTIHDLKQQNDKDTYERFDNTGKLAKKDAKDAAAEAIASGAEKFGDGLRGVRTIQEAIMAVHAFMKGKKSGDHKAAVDKFIDGQKAVIDRIVAEFAQNPDYKSYAEKQDITHDIGAPWFFKAGEKESFLEHILVRLAGSYDIRSLESRMLEQHDRETGVKINNWKDATEVPPMLHEMLSNAEEAIKPSSAGAEAFVYDSIDRGLSASDMVKQFHEALLDPEARKTIMADPVMKSMAAYDQSTLAQAFDAMVRKISADKGLAPEKAPISGPGTGILRQQPGMTEMEMRQHKGQTITNQGTAHTADLRDAKQIRKDVMKKMAEPNISNEQRERLEAELQGPSAIQLQQHRDRVKAEEKQRIETQYKRFVKRAQFNGEMSDVVPHFFDALNSVMSSGEWNTTKDISSTQLFNRLDKTDPAVKALTDKYGVKGIVAAFDRIKNNSQLRISGDSKDFNTFSEEYQAEAPHQADVIHSANQLGMEGADTVDPADANTTSPKTVASINILPRMESEMRENRSREAEVKRLRLDPLNENDAKIITELGLDPLPISQPEQSGKHKSVWMWEINHETGTRFPRQYPADEANALPKEWVNGKGEQMSREFQRDVETRKVKTENGWEKRTTNYLKITGKGNDGKGTQQLIRGWMPYEDMLALHQEALSTVQGYKTDATTKQLEYEKSALDQKFSDYAYYKKLLNDFGGDIANPKLAYAVERAKEFMLHFNVSAVAKKRDKVKGDLARIYSEARVPLMQKKIAESMVVRPKLFDDHASTINSNYGNLGVHVTPAQLHDLYVKNGSDYTQFVSAMGRLTNDMWQKQIDAAYKDAMAPTSGKPVSDEKKVHDVLTSRFTPEQRQAYELYLKDKTLFTSAMSGVPNDAITSGLSKFDLLGELKSFSLIDKFKALEDVKNRVLNAGLVEKSAVSKDVERDGIKLETQFAKEKEAEQKRIADTKETAGESKIEQGTRPDTEEVRDLPFDRQTATEPPEVTSIERKISEAIQHEDVPDSIRTYSDIAREIDPEFHTPDEATVAQKYAGADVKVVCLRNPVLHSFFKTFAGMFGADFIAVKADNTFEGRYIPVGADGRPKIVVNISNQSLSGVFAHELFHHVLNKISPETYQAFRHAMKESVDRDKWEAAIQKLAKQSGYGEARYKAEDVMRQIMTNEFNANPKGSVYKGELLGDKTKDIATAYPDGSIWKRGDTETGGAVAREKLASREGEVPPRDYYSLKSEGNFTHDPYTNESKGFVDASELGAKKSLGEETLDNPRNISGNEREHLENELYAEVFRQAFHQRGFWDALGKSVEGRSVAASLIIKMAGRATDMIRFLRSTANARPEDMSNHMIKSLVLDWGKDFGYKNSNQKDFTRRNVNEPHNSVNALLVDMMNEAMLSKAGLRDNVARDYTDIKDEVFDSAKKAYNDSKAGISAAYSKLIPTGSRNYSGVVDALGKLASAAGQWIKNHSPSGVYEDLKANKRIVNLVQKINSAGKYEETQFRETIENLHGDIFKGMNQEELAGLFDHVVRNGTKENFDALPPRVKEAYKALDVMAKEIHQKLVDAGILKAEQYRPFHFMQSIQWMKGGVPVDEGINTSIRDDRSQLSANDRFTNERGERTTQELIAAGFQPRTLDPMELARNYIRDTSKLIALHEVLNEGMEKGWIRQFKSDAEAAKAPGEFRKVKDDALKSIVQSQGYGFKIKNPDGTYMQKDGVDAIYQTPQSAEQAMAGQANTEGGPTVERVEDLDRYRTSVYYEAKQHQKVGGADTLGQDVWAETGDIRTFDTPEKAAAFMAKNTPSGDKKWEMREQSKKVDTKIIDDLYFHKDMANLLDVVLSKDNLRNYNFGVVTGQQIMKIKNAATMLEMSLSAFHAFTVGTEATTSYAGWMMQRYFSGRNADNVGFMDVVKAFNPAKAIKETRQMDELFRRMMKDPSYAQTEIGRSEMKRLLGTDSVEAADIYKQFMFWGGDMNGQDPTLRSGIESLGDMKYSDPAKNTIDAEGYTKKHFSLEAWTNSMFDTYEKQRLETPDSFIKPLSKALVHQTLQGTTSWLMEDAIPKIKLAAFARDYSLKLERYKDQLASGEMTKEDLGRDTMKFVENRFGEVNWDNMWMDKSYKTALQFSFRSFTWFTGSYAALGKAGIDLGKSGWFKITDLGKDTADKRNYELTEKGYWGIASMAAHVAAVSAIDLMYTMLGGDEQETPEDTPVLTKLLFPRVDPYDATKRISLPGYVTEAAKFMAHFGLNNSRVEPQKLITGRFNSTLGSLVDLMRNEDFRGMTIANPDDSIVGQAYSMAKHMIPMPISFSNVAKSVKSGDGVASAAFGMAGFSDAPASFKRSKAANLAFDLSRREYKGREQSEEEFDMKDDQKRAMKEYAAGDRSKIEEMLANGTMSKQQFDKAITKMPIVDGAANPKYKDELAQAMGRITVKSALKVWDAMTDREKEQQGPEMKKKINNMILKKATPPELQNEYITKWNSMVDGDGTLSVPVPKYGNPSGRL